MGGAGYNQSKGGIPTGGGYQPPAQASYGGQQSQFSAPVTGGMKSASKPAGPTETPTFGSVQSQIKPAATQAPAPTKPTQAPAATKPAVQGGGGQDRGAGDAFQDFKGPTQAPAPTQQAPVRQSGDRLETTVNQAGPKPVETPLTTTTQPIPYTGGYGQRLNDAIAANSRGLINQYSPNAPTAYGSWGAPGAVPGK